MAAAAQDATAVSPSATAVDDQASSSSPPPPRRLSVVERFLEVRGIERKKSQVSETTKPGVVHADGVMPRGPPPSAAAASTLARLPQRTMWQTYTKKRYGERTQWARLAMRVPDDSYSDSADVYNPKKRALVFLKVHEDADHVNRAFLYRARCLLFARDVVDRPVCDLEENQAWYDEALDRVYAASDQDEEEDTDGDSTVCISANVTTDPASDPPDN